MTEEMPHIPKTMSTQHPDNVRSPFFAEHTELGGEDEVREAFYVYSHLGCTEQMWDCEGKEVDNFVIKKLLTRYGDFFRERQLGRDLFLTLRVPNPEYERAEAKILLETLASIPRSCDIANMFYGNEQPPIFEVILPMTTSFAAIDNVYQYYCDFVVGQQYKRLGGRDFTIADWIGRFRPEKINMIPLFEDKEGMLNADTIVHRYIEDKSIPYQRVFLARSDPAVNYGQISAVLLNKIALFRLSRLSKDMGIPLYPIIGAGSAPFRGNLRPDTVQRTADEYRGAHTFTIQSAFKYDHSLQESAEAVEFLEKRKDVAPQPIEEEATLDLIERYSAEYQKQIIALAPVINQIAVHIPSRRKRKLHIGLFGYSRNTGGVTLPRAITVCAALYSIGVPPEILGMNAITDDDLAFLSGTYLNFEQDLKDALRYCDDQSPFLPDGLLKRVEEIVSVKPDQNHLQLTRSICRCLQSCRMEPVTDQIIQAAEIRKFLG